MCFGLVILGVVSQLLVVTVISSSSVSSSFVASAAYWFLVSAMGYDCIDVVFILSLLVLLSAHPSCQSVLLCHDGGIKRVRCGLVFVASWVLVCLSFSMLPADQ